VQRFAAEGSAIQPPRQGVRHAQRPITPNGVSSGSGGTPERIRRHVHTRAASRLRRTANPARDARYAVPRSAASGMKNRVSLARGGSPPKKVTNFWRLFASFVMRI